MAKEESCRYYLPKGKCAIGGSSRCVSKKQCRAYEPADIKPRMLALLDRIFETRPRFISSKDDAMQAIIFLMSEHKILPWEVKLEYDGLVH